MNKEEFIIEVKKLGIDINEEELQKLDIYCKTLLDYNSHTNLTAIKTVEGTYLNHFYDSLTIIKNIDLTRNLKLLDIGTGAGFPGMVLKIFYPNLDVTLLDANNKKTKFLEKLCQELNINDVKIINKRSEDYIKECRYSFDIVTARAVSHLRILLELIMPFLKDDGVFVAMKGNVDTELNEAMETMEILNTRIDKKEEFELPITNSKRTIINFQRNGKILDIYPRSYDKIVKKPLKKKNK